MPPAFVQVRDRGGLGVPPAGGQAAGAAGRRGRLPGCGDGDDDDDDDESPQHPSFVLPTIRHWRM